MANTDITGQILDSSGTAIPNAKVYLWREDLAGAGGVVAQTTADANGDFSITGHPDGTGSSETWHVAAEDPQGDSQLQSAYGISAALPTTVTSQFDVSLTSVSPDPVEPGQTLTVAYDITNTGTDSDTQTLTLSIDNSVGQVDSTSVTLSGGGSTTQTLSWSVSSGQTKQDYTATVSSENDSESTSVTVESAGPNIPLSFENWNGFGQSGLSYVENDANEGGRTYVELPSGRNSFYATASQLGFSNGIKKMQFEVKHPGYTDTIGNGSVIGGISSINCPIDASDDTISIRDEINTESANLSEAVLLIGGDEGKNKIIPDDQLANQWFTISIDVVNGTASANGVTISYEPADSPHDSVVFNQAAIFSPFNYNGNFKVSENYTIIEK